LVCIDLHTGKRKWSRDTRKDFIFREGYFGAGSSPIVVDEKVLLNVGGEGGAGIVAFSMETGETVWKATQEAASYASPVAANVGGEPLVLFVTRLNFIGIDPDTGDVAFRVPFGRRGPTVNGANPLVVDGEHVLLTASYGIGAKLVRIAPAKVSALWERRDVLSSQYPTPVLFDGAVYGVDGREDGPPADLRCIDPRTGDAHWTEAGFGMATFILADGLLLAMKTDGQLVIIEPSQQQYRELARFRLFDSTTRALPALADGKLYVRDTTTLKCLDLSPPVP